MGRGACIRGAGPEKGSGARTAGGSGAVGWGRAPRPRSPWRPAPDRRVPAQPGAQPRASPTLPAGWAARSPPAGGAGPGAPLSAAPAPLSLLAGARPMHSNSAAAGRRARAREPPPRRLGCGHALIDRPRWVAGGGRKWPGRAGAGQGAPPPPPCATDCGGSPHPPPAPPPPARPSPIPPLPYSLGRGRGRAQQAGQASLLIAFGGEHGFFLGGGGGGGVGGRGTRTKKCHFSGACLLLSPARRPLSKKTIPGTHTARPLLHTLTHTARPPPPQHTRQPPPTPHDTHTHTPLKIVGLGPFKANKGEGGNTPFHLLPSSTHAAAASPFFHSSFSHHKSIRASASSRCCPTRTARRPHRVRSGATRASTAWMGE